MNTISSIHPACFARLFPLPLLVASLSFAGGEPAVRIDADGHLSYLADSFGNVVPDFSMAGYRHGGVPLPEAPVRETLHPIAASADDTLRIQAALDRVARVSASSEDGVRGAVLLTRGSYRCEGTLHVAPGVTLRGEGAEVGGSVITATCVPTDPDDEPTLIEIRGSRMSVLTGPAGAVLDQIVPLGAKHLRVADAAAFLAAGDQVLVTREPNQAWIRELKMDQIEKLGPGGKQWTAKDYLLRWRAGVVAVDGESITLDTPVLCALEHRHDQSTVAKVLCDSRGRAAAVERLRLVSVYRPGEENRDEAHAWNAIVIRDVLDCWVREVTALHFANACVNVDQSAARITVQDCAMLDPVSRIAGGRRYSFSGGGQYVLFQRCYARNGRHDFVSGSRDLGPTVFLDCLAEQTHGDIGPHHRWSSGQLYDNVQGGEIHVRDRGRSGTGHGWAGNSQVFWNCVADSFICQRAWLPSAQNWAIGCIGRRGEPSISDRPDGWWESFGRHVEPRSLYLAQLHERIVRGGGDGDAALRAVTTPEQRAGTVWAALRARYGGDR